MSPLRRAKVWNIIRRFPPDTTFFLGPDKASALDMFVTLQNFLLIMEIRIPSTPEQKVRHIKTDFTLYRSVGSDGKGKVLFTGYYEPMLSCRVGTDETYRFPLYRRPDDIIEVDLAQFGNGFPKNKLLRQARRQKGRPLLFAGGDRSEEDPCRQEPGDPVVHGYVDIYVLQVQGSGKVDLGDGNILSVLYDGANGQALQEHR